MERKLIITADDYGMCEAINKAIEECLAAGALRATCVMTNMPAYDAVASVRQTFPNVSLGIHWTLTDGRPVLPPSQVPTLVTRDGNFLSAMELRRRWLRRQINVAELNVELRAQYQRFREVAGSPDFWNTHENFHVLPGLFTTCVSLGRELHIPIMRCHRRFTIPRDYSLMSYNFRHPTYYVKGWGIGWWSRSAKRQGMLMPDGIVHMPGYEPAINSIEHAISRLPWSTINKAVELVIHPATTSNNKFFRLNAERRVHEYHVFKDPKLLSRLQQINVETVGFEAL
jgi:predicted glycoside hydrolase/deacetylase ChbG (UPF0249 family)